MGQEKHANITFYHVSLDLKFLPSIVLRSASRVTVSLSEEGVVS